MYSAISVIMTMEEWTRARFGCYKQLLKWLILDILLSATWTKRIARWFFFFYNTFRADTMNL
jgi:hypothetical protein